MTGKVDGHVECNSVDRSSTEETNQNKYLVFDSIDENKEVLNKYRELWDEIKNAIETISSGKKSEYGEDFMKIKFNTDDNLH